MKFIMHFSTCLLGHILGSEEFTQKEIWNHGSGHKMNLAGGQAK